MTKSPIVAALIVLFAHTVACGGAPDRPALAEDPAATGADVAVATAANPCADGDVTKCSVYTSADHRDCFKGEQLCQSGAWSACEDAASFGSRTLDFPATCPAAVTGTDVQKERAFNDASGF